METKDKTTKRPFKKKVYQKLNTSPLSRSIDSQSITPPSSSGKKIIPTTAISGLREEFKKTFLPLLIDIFELRQMLENFKAHHEGVTPLPTEQTKSPHEILQRLEMLQKDVEESQRWHDGVILQISKGIEEAREVLDYVETIRKEEKKSPFWKKLFTKMGLNK